VKNEMAARGSISVMASNMVGIVSISGWQKKAKRREEKAAKKP